MDAHISHGVQPVAPGGIERGKRRQLQTGEKIFFHVPHTIFNAPFFISLFWRTGDRIEAVMSREIQIARIKMRWLACDMFQHAGFKVVDHHSGRRTTKKLQRMTMARKELLHALAEGELDIHHAAVAKDHHKEMETPAGGAHGNGAIATPIDLGAVASRKIQHQESGFADRSDQTHELLEDAVAAGVALGPNLLEHLLS